MTDLLAFVTIISWPIIPLFWIPVHLFSNFFRKFKFLPYLIPFGIWLPLAYLLSLNRAFLLQEKIEFPRIIVLTGWILLVSGSLLHIWTGRLLSLRGITGVPEISQETGGKVVRKGAFSIVRHPTYLAHTLMFSGVFLISGVINVGLITLLDFAVVNIFIIPLEEKELTRRFGEAYRLYITEVPSFFPRGKRSR